MDANKENKTTITIHREHDKIELLEKLLHKNGLKNMESLVSNLIDFMIVNNTEQINSTLNLLKSQVSDQNIFNIIINMCQCISKQTPLIFTIEVNHKNIKYINYINTYQDILPLF